MDVVTWWKCVIQVSILKPTSHLPRDVVFMRSYKPLQTRSGWLYYEEVFDLKTLYESSFFLFHQSRGGKNYTFLIGENVLLLLSLLLGRGLLFYHIHVSFVFCQRRRIGVVRETWWMMYGELYVLVVSLITRRTPNYLIISIYLINRMMMKKITFVVVKSSRKLQSGNGIFMV